MLNFKDWKIVSQDGEKATLKHASGHTMAIAMKALPKIQREQILRLAKLNEYKDGGKVQKFADKPDGVSADASDSDSNDDSNQGSATPAATHITINAGTAASAPAPVVAPAANPAAAYAAKPVNVIAPQIPSGVSNLNAVTGTMNPTAVAQNAQEAVKGQQAIDTAKTAAAVPLEQGYIQGVSENQKNAQALYNQMQGHVEDFNKYIQANPVNPNAYVQNMGGAKRALTGLGLILGGLGAGQLGSTDNPALRFLNNQIDRDIEGQKSRINNQHTVLGAYNNLYGEGVAANNLTKASLLDLYNHKAQLLANQLGTPQAKVNAQQLGANIAIEKSKLLQDAAVNLTNLPGTQPTSSDMGAANVPRGTPGQPGATTADQIAQAQAGKLSLPVGANAESEMAPKQGQMAGISASGTMGEKRSPLDTIGDNNQILHPDAEHRLNNLRYGAPKDRQDFETARAQYDQAFNADQQLKQVNSLYKRLYGETNGMSGRIHRGINPHAIAAGMGAIGTGAGALALGVPGAIAGGSVGTALGEGAGHGIKELTNTGANQEYDRDLEALKGIISASLKNRGDMTVEEAVQKFAPTERDSPEQAMKKREEFKKFIASHIDKGIISLHGIAQAQK